MDVEKTFERAGIAFTRILIAVSTLLGFYLLLSGDSSIIQRILGVALISVGLFLTYHHSVVILRGSMRVHDE